MGLQRQNGRHPWLLAVLVPFWILQFPLQTAIFGFTIYNAIYSIGIKVMFVTFLDEGSKSDVSQLFCRNDIGVVREWLPDHD